MVKYIDESKAIGISLKIPTKLLDEMKEVEIREHTTRTGLIIKCLEGYLNSGTTKFEIQLIERIAEIESELSKVNQKVSQFEDIIQKQNDIMNGFQQTINYLLSTKDNLKKDK